MGISAMGRKLLRELGTPEEIYQDLKLFRRDVNLLAEQRPTLTTRYPNKWIAFHEGQVVLVADTLNGLLQMIDKQGLSRDKVITQFLSTEKMTMVL